MNYLLFLNGLYVGNQITSLDFNAKGDSVAILDLDGVCLISEINANNCNCQLNLPNRLGILVFSSLLY